MIMIQSVWAACIKHSCSLSDITQYFLETNLGAVKMRQSFDMKKCFIEEISDV